MGTLYPNNRTRIIKAFPRPTTHFLVGIFILVCMVACGTPSEAQSRRLEPGSGVFEMSDQRKEAARINIFYHLPQNFGPESKVVIVLHGVKRNADRYRDNWVNHSGKYGFLIVAPEFSMADYPGADQYNLGNMFNTEGKPNPRACWSYPVIERVFQKVVKLTGSAQKRFYVFGHSAGAQFVHRMVLFAPPRSMAGAIAANAGWYTMPDFSEEFPYGLKGAPLNKEGLKNAFICPLVIMAGDKDTDPHHKYLRRTPEAMSQGEHRLARSRTFFKAAQKEARALGTEFNWQYVLVPGVGHSNRKMSLFAAEYIAAQ